MRIVVLGGAGNFGARICRALVSDSDLQLISANRRDRPPADPRISTTIIDLHSRSFADDLCALRPDLVIHCVGPFQGQDYRVAQATLMSGAHYIDLADGRAFVAGFRDALDAQAVAANRIAITGASTLPALSSAVVDALQSGLERLESIDIAIAPGQRAPRGVATLQAVFSYLGQPFRWLRRGRWEYAYGWQHLKRLQFDFGRRWAAVCDVPDLELFPERYPGVKSVSFRAALELSVQHFFLWGLAALRRIGVPIRIDRWAGTLDHLASKLDRFGGAFGGMRVSIVGAASDGSRSRRTWHLTAPAMDGPEIPCIAAILLARRLAEGVIYPKGATPCMGKLSLKDFGPEFARWCIRTRVEEGPA